MNPRFALKNSDGGEIELRPSMTVGKLDTSDIVLREGLPSRQHARLTIEGDQLFVEDLQSRNGTFVNGFKIAARTKVFGGDKVKFDVSEFSVIGPPRPGTARDDQATQVRSVPSAPAAATPATATPAAAPATAALAAAPPAVAAPEPAHTVSLQKAATASGNGSAQKIPKPWMPPPPNSDQTHVVQRKLSARVAPDTSGGSQEHVDIPTLLVKEGSVPAQRFEMSIDHDAHQEWAIGSGSECQLVLANREVSAIHAVISRDHGKWQITDKFSTNGTYVNEQSTVTRILVSGDQLRFGPVEVTFLLPGLFSTGKWPTLEAGKASSGMGRRTMVLAAGGFVLTLLLILAAKKYFF